MSLEAWLQGRPTIAVIARDRSTEYARGAAKGAPGAIQVADRWHLLANLREMIARWLSGIHGRLRRLPAVPGMVSPTRRTRAYPRSRAEVVATADYRARRLAVYEEVRRRFGAGEKLLAISRALGLARSTVRRYAYAESFPEHAVRVPPPGILDPWLEHLEARLAAGCENGMALWREIRDLGFAGTPKQVHCWLSTRRTAPAKRTPHKWRSTGPDAGPTRPSDADPALLPPRQLAWLLVQVPQALDASQTATLTRITQDAEVAGVVPLVRRFADLIRTCGINRDKAPADPTAVFAAWLVDAQACGVRAVETFAAGLQQDDAAIKAALTLPWSSGQAEGQINKLKLIKRQMYGRANFDLIRRRVLLAA